MEREPPTAEQLAALPSTCLVQGRWIKADLHRVEWRGHSLVVKSFARKSLPVRWIGRLQIAREERAYRALAGVAGIPALRGRPDPDTLLLDYVEGRRLTHVQSEPRPERRRYVDRLARLVGEIHARGVTHIDLRGRDNVLVGPDGNVWMIDFAAAHVAPAGTWPRRFVFPLLRSIDRSAFLKWKHLLTPEDLTDRERRKMRRYRRWRRLWVFNRKKVAAPDAAAPDGRPRT
jgi:predicted Ser/Thr protein kinase